MEKQQQQSLVLVEQKALAPKKKNIHDVQKWIKLFNSEPDKTKVKVNKMANNSKYLPISHIEAMLDKYFFGRWSVRNFSFENIANEVIGSCELVVVHPYTNEEIVRAGVASVQIRVNKDTGKKITNALVCDIPHLKAECIKNAAKSLGKVFGRDIARKSEDIAEFDALLKEQQKKKDKELFN